MRIQDISYHNDSNYIDKDGTKYISKRLNPSYVEGKEEKYGPEYIDEEIPIDGTKSWAVGYVDDQHKWATSQERENSRKEDLSGIEIDEGEDALEIALGIHSFKQYSAPTNEYVNEEKKRKLELLAEFKKMLNPAWQELLDKIYADDMQLEEIRREEIEKTGIVKTNQSYSKKHMKAIERLKDLFEAAGYEVDRAPRRKAK